MARTRTRENKRKARNYMCLYVSDHEDMCGEVNCTTLAEAAANEHDLYEDDYTYTIPKWVYDMAVDVAEAYTERSK